VEIVAILSMSDKEIDDALKIVSILSLFFLLTYRTSSFSELAYSSSVLGLLVNNCASFNCRRL